MNSGFGATPSQSMNDGSPQDKKPVFINMSNMMPPNYVIPPTFHGYNTFYSYLPMNAAHAFPNPMPANNTPMMPMVGPVVTPTREVPSKVLLPPKRVRNKKRPVPDEQKTEDYFARRRKNNEAAKKSRDTRRQEDARNELILKDLKQDLSRLDGEIQMLDQQVKDLTVRVNAGRYHPNSFNHGIPTTGSNINHGYNFPIHNATNDN